MFGNRKSNADGKRYICKECEMIYQKARWKKLKKTGKTKEISREQNLKRSCRIKNITIKDYCNMFDNQDGKCAICKTSHKTHYRHLDIDHCHKTGRVRGLLCSKCNLMIGYAEDNSKTLKSAIKYLES